MIGDWRARSSMVSQVFRRGLVGAAFDGSRFQLYGSVSSEQAWTRDVCTVGPNLRSVIGLIT